MQLGHQAINCTNGTINWKQIYGEESFKLKTPTYPSEYDAVAKAKQVDVQKLKKLAEEWKNVCPTLCILPASSHILHVMASQYGRACRERSHPLHAAQGSRAVLSLMRKNSCSLTTYVCPCSLMSMRLCQ